MKVYTTKTCAYCPMVKKYLTSKGVEFTEIDVEDNPDIRQELFNKTGAMSVPITEKDGQYVIGWNPSELAKLIG
jgi:glutaredoxin 3